MSPRVISWYLSEQLDRGSPVSTWEAYYLRIAATGVLKERPSESPLIYVLSAQPRHKKPSALARKPTNAKSLGDSWQVPHWFNCELRHSELACSILADLAIRHTIEPIVSELAVLVWTCGRVGLCRPRSNNGGGTHSLPLRTLSSSSGS
jgi:hypothetical protein